MGKFLIFSVHLSVSRQEKSRVPAADHKEGKSKRSQALHKAVATSLNLKIHKFLHSSKFFVNFAMNHSFSKLFRLHNVSRMKLKAQSVLYLQCM